MFIFILNNQTQIKADDYKKIWKQNIIDFSKVVFIILIKSPSAVYLQRVFFIYGYYLFVRIHLWILSVCTDTFMDIICLYGYICGYYLFVRMSEHITYSWTIKPICIKCWQGNAVKPRKWCGFKFEVERVDFFIQKT